MKEIKEIREIFVKDRISEVPFKVVDGYPMIGDVFKNHKITYVKNVDNKFPNDELMSLLLIGFENNACEFVAVEW